MSAADLREAQAAGAQIVDVRGSGSYVGEHVPDSINIPYIRHGFTEQAAFYLERDRSVVLLADSMPIADVAGQALRNAGFSVLGALEGGISAWKQAGGAIAAIGEVTAAELEDLIEQGDAPLIVDVRETWEFNAGHIGGSRHMPMSQFTRTYRELPQDASVVFVCASGARSGEVVQFLYRLGYRKVYNLTGGMAEWLAGRRRA